MTTNDEVSPGVASSGGGQLIRTLLIATIAGALVGAVDVAFNFATGERESVHLVGRYVIAVDTLAGFGLGVVVAVLLGFGLFLGADRGIRRLLVWLPVAVAAGFTFRHLNLDLFDGAAVREKSWAPLAKKWGIPGAAVGIGLVVLWFSRAWRWSSRTRLVLAVSCLAGLPALTYANQRLFGAYPNIKMQLAFGTWLCAIGLLLFPTLRTRRFRVLEGLLVLTAVGAAIWFGMSERREKDIHRARGAVVGIPYPATARVMGPVEDVLLARLVPLEDVMSTNVRRW